MKQFMISFFFPLVHDKHLQTSPELTTMTTYNEGVKKMKQQKSPLSSLPPSPLPCPLIPLFFFTLMCFCSLWRWRGEIERGSWGGTDPAAHLRFIWPPPGECGEVLHLKEIASAFWSAWHTHKHTHMYTYTHMLLSWLKCPLLPVTVAKFVRFSSPQCHNPLVHVSIQFTLFQCINPLSQH